MTLPEIIQTERLVLRPWSLRDAEAVFSYARDEEWSRYLPVPRPYTRQDAERFVAHQALLDRRTDPAWALELDGAIVGGVNLRFSLEHRVGEIGCAVARPQWRWGLGTEAAAAVVHHAFSSLDELARVRASADVRNVASIRLMEKIGMAREGVLRRNRAIRGELVDEACYGMLRSEWDRIPRGREAGWHPGRGLDQRAHF